MKNFFIVNPIAGKGKGVEIVEEKIASLSKEIKNNNECFIIKTTKPNEAKSIVNDIVNKNPNEVINIFACGGDGTCFEVLNGIIGKENINFGIVPVGSCNDFLKTYPEYDFLDLEKQLLGTVASTDIIKVDDEYILNVVNFGFDARANYDQIRLRPKFKTVKGAYNWALFRNIISPKLGDKVEVFVDEKCVFKGKMLLSAFANAKYYGGGYKCAPLASTTDGLIDMIIVKKVSIITFAKLVKYYKNGEHLSNPKFDKYVKFFQGKKVEIKAEKDLVACLDGETRIKKHYNIKILEKQINLILPKYNN